MKKLLLIVVLVVSMLPINFFVGKVPSGTTNSINIVNEYDASLADDETVNGEIADDYIITIKHNKEYVEEKYVHSKLSSCNNHETPDEKLINLRKDMAEYYAEENEQIIESLNLEKENVKYSLFAPFIQIAYDDYNQYLNSGFDVSDAADASIVNTIYINNGIESIDNASIRNSGYVGRYYFEDALADVGIDSSAYNGDGVRIGVVETGSPKELYGLDANQTFVWDETTKQSEHSVVVGNIIGGEYGISQNSEIYFSALGNNADDTFYDAINWQLSYPQSVHLINMSWGSPSGGLYTSTSALLDYLTVYAKVLFVVCAHNNTSTVNSYSTGFNTISVGSTDVDGDISWFSNAGVGGSLVGRTNKPTVVAPGGRLYNLGDIPNHYLDYNSDHSNDGHSGTSFSAPIVTGICALLIDEYDYLMLQPWTLHSIIISGTNFVNGQTTEYDALSGYGIIDYEKCRQIVYDNNFIDVTSSSNLTVYYPSITIPAGSTINMTGVMFMPGDEDADFGRTQVTHIEQTNYKISLVVDDSDRTVLVSNQNSTNYFDLTYTNSQPVSITCILKVEVVGDFENSSTVYGSFSYYGEGIHTHWYRMFPLLSITSTHHVGYCNCGASKRSVHMMDPTYNDLSGNGRYVPCYYCNYMIDTWNTGAPEIMSFS